MHHALHVLDAPAAENSFCSFIIYIHVYIYISLYQRNLKLLTDAI